MNFLFVCSGTAGHINPAITIAAELKDKLPDCRVLFIGADRELDNKLIPKAGFKVINIKMSGLRRGISLKKILYNINTTKKLIAASIEAEKIIKDFKPDVVIGTGGYICYPVLRKAAKMKIPTIVHDSNAIPGLTTKYLSGIVDYVLVSFHNQSGLYKKPERVLYTGTPVRKEFQVLLSESLKKSLYSELKSKFSSRKRPLLVSFWGSLGAEKLNEIIAEVIYFNINNRVFDHIHAAGKKDGVSDIKARLKLLGISNPENLPDGIEIKEYIEDMPGRMVEADLILCRGGGSTIAELTEICKPAIIIPSPYVVNNEHEYNVKELLDVSGVVLLKEKDSTGESLFSTIKSLITDNKQLGIMSNNIKSISNQNATDKIIDVILSLC